MTSKFRIIGNRPSDIMFNLFDVLIKPILLYGSDVWGLKSKLWGSIDIVFLQYSWCILHVKATTNNIITTGECGRFPPSAYCHISALCYLNRLHHMDVNKLTKQVFCDLVDLSQQGFITWGTDALTLADALGLDITSEKNMLSMNCKEVIHKKKLLTCGWLLTKFATLSPLEHIQSV